jgi:hypothetical protein
MSLLANLTTDDSIEDERDSVGGGGVLESGLYNATVTLAYLSTAASGATGLVLQFKTEEDKVIRSTQWVVSGTAKGCKNYYERDGKKNYLPGFLLANSLSKLATGKEISELDTDEKVINVYNAEAKAEVPTKVPMITELLGKSITIGLLKQIADKSAKGDDGQYHPTGETREENEIDKFFHAESKMTTSEIKASASEPVFINTWDQKWAGVTRDRSTKTGGTAGAPKAKGAASTKPATSLFS